MPKVGLPGNSFGIDPRIQVCGYWRVILVAEIRLLSLPTSRAVMSIFMQTESFWESQLLPPSHENIQTSTPETLGVFGVMHAALSNPAIARDCFAASAAN